MRTESNNNLWIRRYREKEAFWIHDGNPKRPHALLTSDKHSNGFFNSRLIIKDEVLLHECALALVELVTIFGLNIEGVDRVVGPKTGATTLATLISERIGELRGYPCEWASPAKHGEGKNKRMVFESDDHRVHPGERVLLCEDVSTTFGSLELTSDAVTEARGVLLPFALLLVNRSSPLRTTVNGQTIVSLIEHEMPIWAPDECPLCKLGSKALRPKDNWAALTAAY